MVSMIHVHFMKPLCGVHVRDYAKIVRLKIMLNDAMIDVKSMSESVRTKSMH